MSTGEILKQINEAGWTEIRVYGHYHQFANPDYRQIITLPVYPGKEVSMEVLKNLEKGTGLSFHR